jgi:mono/diheme cytochrome c family protein
MSTRPLLLGWFAIVGSLGTIAVVGCSGEARVADSPAAITLADGAPAGVALAAAQAPAPPTADRVARGRYLVRAIGCGDCHSPKVMTSEGPVDDESRFLSGHPAATVLAPPPAPPEGWAAVASNDLTAWSGPWGVSYAANLTPDENTGIGIWTEEMFIKTIRNGRHMGQSRPLLPPMPWQVYRTLTDEDLKAVYAYLRTIPPVHNRVPEPVPPPGTGVVASAGG